LRASGKPGLVGGFHIETSSLLTWNMNRILARALNSDRKKVTHLCILHTDIEVEQLWLDKMMKIMEEKKADIVSVAMPLKNGKKDTSTAIYEKNQDRKPARTVTRLTMEDIEKRGGTFTEEGLLVNTGLMLIDMRGNWFDGSKFTMEDVISKDEQGIYHAHIFPEDWEFSHQAALKGASIWVTNEIQAWHHGGGRWGNQLVESEKPKLEVV
jgi:GT2 family glycosyltransferase